MISRPLTPPCVPFGTRRFFSFHTLLDNSRAWMCILAWLLFLFRRYHLQIVFHMKLSVIKSTFSYFHCLCLLKFSPLLMFATISLLWLLLTSRHSLLLTDFLLCFHPLTRPPLVPHVSFSPYICHIYYS